jgi:hypothetical protein
MSAEHFENVRRYALEHLERMRRLEELAAQMERDMAPRRAPVDPIETRRGVSIIPFRDPETGGRVIVAVGRSGDVVGYDSVRPGETESDAMDRVLDDLLPQMERDAAARAARATLPPVAVSAPIRARSDDAALFELLASVGCRMPKEAA